MAVYTHLSHADITEILHRFPSVPDGAFRFSGIEMGTVNTFYLIEYFAGSKAYYLKIDEVADLKRLRNETLILRCLEKESQTLSFQVPIPVKTEVLGDWTLFNGKPALLFPEIPGRSLFGDDLKIKHLTVLGEKLAELHAVTPDSKIQPHRFNMTGITLVHDAIKNDLKLKHPELSAFVENTLTQLTQNEPRKLKSVLIHADLFAENILWVKNSFSAILDFEAAGLGPALFDVAVCLHALCHNGQSFDHERIKAFFAGYNKKHPFSKSTTRLLVYYLRQTTLRFLLTRLKGFELKDADPKTPHFKDYREFVRRFQEVDELEKLWI